MKTWLCVVCGLVYDEAKGWPKDGIVPGTRWEDVPADWLCPECGVGKADFEMLDITSDMPETPITLLAAEAANAGVPSEVVPEGPVVIIGSGHAGYGLAKALRRLNADREIHIFTADDGGRYSKPALSNALAMKKDAHTLLEESALAIEQRLNIRVHAFCPVLSIDTKQQTLVTRLGDMNYEQLVLATGARPIRIGFTGDQSALLAVNDRKDYQRMRAKLDCLDEPAQVTIIGDGLIGCEFANDLAQAGHEVNVVGLADRPLSRLLPVAGSEVLRRGLSEIGVQWYLSRSLADVKNVPGGSYRLTLTDGTTLGDGVCAACHDDYGVMVGFALVGKEAMTSRSEWIKACGKATEELV